MHRIIAIIIITGVLMMMTAVSFASGKDSTLTAKQQAIVPIASYMASGDMENLKKAIADGLDAGLTVNETKEIMVHLYAYCGFPRALNGLGAVSQVVQQRQQQGIKDVEGPDASPIPEGTDMMKLGTEVQTKLSGAPVHVAVSPAIDTFLKTHLFGDLFARDVLSAKDREIVTESALASMTGTQSQLNAHFRIGMNAGITADEMQDIVDILSSRISPELAKTAQQTLDTFLAGRK